jgi:hypothetical protein
MESQSNHSEKDLDLLTAVESNIIFTLGVLRNPINNHEHQADIASTANAILQGPYKVRLVPGSGPGESSPKADNIFSRGELRLKTFDIRPNVDQILLICFRESDTRETVELLASQVPDDSQIVVEESMVVSATQQFKQRYSNLDRNLDL